MRKCKSTVKEVQKQDEEVMAVIESCYSLATFEMPLHCPRYKKADYEKMEEWKVDVLLREREYGLNLKGSLEEKRKFAMGTFLWPDQL
ncbi:uncharacterized protein LOC113771972 [Coffea eugenioides]|uniref:uncharacterized protein LOC113771972 n=1 Tax=Coffea eugenioides TaxID=49369 RepID=UPI000F60CDB9|nr:uncharacterized protein LOC113771972 [Coffea eugenioides]